MRDGPDACGDRSDLDTMQDINEEQFLTVAEVGVLLRTTRKAIYAMIERRQLPGVRRIGRRVLIDRRELLHWLHHTCASSPLE